MNKLLQCYYNFSICDGDTHILKFQPILYVVILTVISSICLENIINFQLVIIILKCKLYLF